MLINTKCERCNEPTKHVVGFWDGENGKSGFVHDCENEKCEEYLLKNEKKYNASGLSVSERLLLLGPFTGEQKDWKELERWVDTVNKIIYDLQKNRQ